MWQLGKPVDNGLYSVCMSCSQSSKKSQIGLPGVKYENDNLFVFIKLFMYMCSECNRKDNFHVQLLTLDFNQCTVTLSDRKGQHRKLVVVV